jgi:anti-sigma B factor antagonist
VNGVHWCLPAEMEITQNEIAPATVVVTVTGKIMWGAESEKLEDVVAGLLRDGKRTIIFDIAGVNRIDSTGIGRFIASYNKIAAAGGKMRMAGAASYLFQVFHISGLDSVFRFYPDVEEACKAG